MVSTPVKTVEVLVLPCLPSLIYGGLVLLNE